MPPRRHTASWALLSVTFFLLAAAGAAVMWNQASQGSTGTIYYADIEGLWKVQMPSLEEKLLWRQRLIHPRDLALSRDQQWLSLASYDSTDEGEARHPLWVVNTQSGTAVQVDPNATLRTFWLDDHQLLYAGQEGISNFDPQKGTRQRAEDWRRAYELCWTWLDPSGKLVLLQHCRPDEPARSFLRLVDLDGQHPITITEPYYWGNAEWSVDGERILFTDGDSENQRLFMWHRRDGTLRQVIGQVSRQAYTFTAPSWSPDGKWLAFSAGTMGMDLCFVEIATGDTKCYSDHVSAVGTRVAWSPDSRAILIFSNRVGEYRRKLVEEGVNEWHLFIIVVPDGEITQITRRNQHPRAYVWGSQ